MGKRRGEATANPRQAGAQKSTALQRRRATAGSVLSYAASRMASLPYLNKQGSLLIPTSHSRCIYTSNFVSTGEVFRNPSKKFLVKIW